MRKILNPYAKHKDQGFQCFGCSPSNPDGLKLEFWSTDDEVICKWIPEHKYEGYLNMIHGGIQATLHDEIAAWVVYTKCKTSGVTSNLEVRYKKPLVIDGSEITIRGKIENANKKLVVINTIVENEDGICYSTGKVTFFLFPQEIAIEKYSYPGINAFFDDTEK